MILDAQPTKHRRGEAGLASHFQLLAEASPEEIFAHHLKQATHQGLRLSEFLSRTELSEARLRQVAAALQRAGRVRAVHAEMGWYIHTDALDALTSALHRFLESFHRQNPLKPNLSIEELRAKVRGLGERVCVLALEELRRQGIVVVERDRVRLATHQVALDDTRERLLNEIEAAFLAAGYQPPRAEEVFDKLNIGKGHDKALLQVLLDQGRAVRLKDNVVFHRSNLDKAESLLVGYLRDHREITPIEFKDLLGISRKYAIPLLEYFDSQRVTMRVGDKRILRGVS
jgi:selenocysteine-specific elongation factor